jgi:hypothetical protein
MIPPHELTDMLQDLEAGYGLPLYHLSHLCVLAVSPVGHLWGV